MAIRTYEYGCGRGPIEGLECAIEQMRRRTEFWNRLVEIDNDVRARMDALLFAGEREIDLARLRDQLKCLVRNGATPPAEKEAAVARKQLEIRGLRDAVRVKLEEVKRARKENAGKHRAQLRELDDERKRRVSEVHAEAGLYWANRDEIRRKYELSRARAIRAGRRLRPQPWDETGRIHIHFQRGLAVPGAFCKNGRFQIEPVADAAWLSPSRAERRRLARTRLRMRIIANEDGSPVWLEAPVILHRPLPPKGVIRSVSFVRERVGLGWRHRVLLAVAEAPLPDPPISAKTVGLDLGWRLLPEGLRVAYWAGDDGCRGELVLPISDLGEFKKLGALQAAILEAHAQAAMVLRAFVKEHTVPGDLGRSAAEAAVSPAPRTLVQCFEKWEACRFAGDRRTFAALRAWHKQHVHLWTWQVNLRDQLLRRRRELYRRFAASLSDRYGQIFVNDIQLRRLTVRPVALDTLIPAQRYHRFIGALSVLHSILQNACDKRGGFLNLVKCEHSTRSCHFCGLLENWNPRATLTHACSGCGQSWDQDYNAAVHVLRQGLATRKSLDRGC